MARDRKRAKQRKERQERASGAQRRARAAAPEQPSHDEHDPPELAGGELDIADAQLALGRPELADAGDPVAAEAAGDPGPGSFSDEQEFEQLEDRVDDAEEQFEQAGNGHAGDVELAPRAQRTSSPAAREDGNRFANFIRGSWRELQRVQWPDRPQVGQATAVVIGFVIVAGAFLGAMDFVAAKIVDFIV